jgi:hypothetical protein
LTTTISNRQHLIIKFWLPALVNGGLVWLLLLLVGDTPLVRASGLALVITGVTLAFRRMGSLLSMVGGLTLALSPAFWSQTGGGTGDPATIVLALGAATLTVLITIALSQRPYIALGMGIVIFALLFWSQIGTERSLRLTGFVVAWLMFLLIDMLLLTNPRPDDAPLILRSGPKNPDGSQSARYYHTLGLLLLLAVGILNDPLLTLLIPAVALALFLSNTELPAWYWLALLVACVAGARGIAIQYLDQQSYLIALDEWRHAERWLDVIQLVIEQYTVIGIGLAALGLARLSRWYPPLGTVTLVAFAAYGFFGLVYTGNNREVLLLPFFVIHVLWMTYAIFSLGEWLGKTLPAPKEVGHWLAIAGYTLLPGMMLLRIV